MFSNFIVSIIEVVIYSIVFAFLFCLVLGRIWFFSCDICQVLVGAFDMLATGGESQDDEL